VQTNGLAPLVLLLVLTAPAVALGAPSLKLLPYPQQVEVDGGSLPLGPAHIVTDGVPSPTERIAADTLRRFLPSVGRAVTVRLGSVEEGYDQAWLAPAEREFLSSPEGLKPEASVVTVTPEGITVVGQSRWGMLYGVQTVNQLAREASGSLPRLTIRDWPDMPWRCLSPTLTWYSGWNRLEGYDLCNWSLGEWKWLVDWSLLHKMNAWAVCMYGYWPFDLPGYEESTLQVDSSVYDPATGRKTPRRSVHANIRKEFLPELLAYARERGIRVYAYIGKNSFNGGYILRHPEANAGGAAEALPFAPGVHDYWDAFIGRILESGFDGFVFEDPEAYHVPNQNEECFRAFWEPWAKQYGFGSREETDQNKPPLGVHIEYYCWLFRQFHDAIDRHAQRLGWPAETFLISHILLSRIVGESKSSEEMRRWFELVDEKHGQKVRFIINEADEAKYTALFGGDRVASLGGRGGSCLCAWRRMTGVNNNATGGPMGASVDWERDCQRRIYRAGGFGAMGYTFEWRSNEIYGYIAAQHLWRHDGVPGINNEDQIGFLDHAYRMHYGDRVGPLVARALDTSPSVNDAMVLEEIHGAQYPETGRAIHRDYQLLAARADQAMELAREAYRLWAGHEPDLFRPAYQPERFRWSGQDAAADRLFKEESLRWLCVELRRAQVLCEAALAHRLAARRAAEGTSTGAVVRSLDRAIAMADENQRLYQVNFDDDYDWNEGLCVKLADRFRELREPFAKAAPGQVPEELRASLGAPLYIPWQKLTDIVPATHDAKGPGLYVSVDLGINALREEACLGAVFTVEARSGADTHTLFRRALGRYDLAWEHWDIPLPNEVGRRGPVAIRLLADAYSRAQNRDALSWQWPIWGDPQVVEVGADGARRTLYRLADHADDAQPFVILDGDGRERAFDQVGGDSTGAAFELLAPSTLTRLREGEGRGWQWVEGFAGGSSANAPHSGWYRSYLASVPSWWGYAYESGEVTWETQPVPEARDTAVVFIGGTNYEPGPAELWCDGRRLLAFETGHSADVTWRGDDVELRYLHGADTRDERVPYGLSGVFVIRLPADRVTPGRALRLTVKLLPQPANSSWFMVHGFASALRAAERVLAPEPRQATFVAFPPHLGGAWGVIGAEFAVQMRGAE